MELKEHHRITNILLKNAEQDIQKLQSIQQAKIKERIDELQEGENRRMGYFAKVINTFAKNNTLSTLLNEEPTAIKELYRIKIIEKEEERDNQICKYIRILKVY